MVMTKTSVINTVAYDGVPDGTIIVEPITHDQCREHTLIVGKATIEIFLAAELRRFLERTMQHIPEDSSDPEVIDAIEERLGGFYDLAFERAADLAEVKQIESHRSARRKVLQEMLIHGSKSRISA